MGVTVSHSVMPPISLASTIIGFISFAFTLATFFNVFWGAIQSLYAAPSQITDYLSNLKQGLLAERRHLRKIRKRRRSAKRDSSHLRGRSPSHPEHGRNGTSRAPSRSRGPGKGSARHHHVHMHFDRDMQSLHSWGEGAELRAMRIAVRDMVRTFRTLEFPFLKPEFQNLDSAHWSTVPNAYPNALSDNEKGGYFSAREDEDDDGFQRSNRLGSEYRSCSFRERWLWLRRKKDVVSLMEALSRAEVRRTAHEVGSAVMMVGDIGKDLEDMRDSVLALEGRLSRVVGVRRVD